jgi:hypothetical protein
VGNWETIKYLTISTLNVTQFLAYCAISEAVINHKFQNIRRPFHHLIRRLKLAAAAASFLQQSINLDWPAAAAASGTTAVSAATSFRRLTLGWPDASNGTAINGTANGTAAINSGAALRRRAFCYPAAAASLQQRFTLGWFGPSPPPPPPPPVGPPQSVPLHFGVARFFIIITSRFSRASGRQSG